MHKGMVLRSGSIKSRDRCKALDNDETTRMGIIFRVAKNIR